LPEHRLLQLRTVKTHTPRTVPKALPMVPARIHGTMRSCYPLADAIAAVLFAPPKQAVEAITNLWDRDDTER